LAALFLATVSQLTSRFPLIMVAGGFDPYHRLWPDDAPCERIVVTPTLGGMIAHQDFVTYIVYRQFLRIANPEMVYELQDALTFFWCDLIFSCSRPHLTTKKSLPSAKNT
jgi:hypothetical protein